MHNGKYPALVIASAVIYGVCPTLIKLTYAFGGNGLLCTFYICLFALPFLYGWMRRAGVGLKVDRRTLGSLGLLALSSSATSLLLNSSYAFIPVGMATTLHFIYPVAVAAYLFCFFRQRMGALRMAALALSAAGVLFQSAGSLTGGNLTGIALAAGSGLTWAFYMVYMEKSGLKDLHASVLNFYMALGNAICAGVASGVTNRFAVFGDASIWLLLLFVGFAQRVAANAMFQVGLRGTGSFRAGIFSTFELTTSVIVGVIALREHFTQPQLIGMALILSGIATNLYAGVCDNRRRAAARG